MTGIMNLLEAAAKFQAIGKRDDRGPDSSISHKMLGNSPLLETGEMRASIEWNSHGLEGHVGSNSDKAVWQELGTSRIPPRSFLVGAAVHMEEQIHKMAARWPRAPSWPSCAARASTDQK
jgi:hypothetical protein